MGEVTDSDDSTHRIDIGAHTESSLSSDSMFHMRASELYPKCDLIKDQETVSLPFEPLCGEDVKFLGQVNGGVAALSNYRFLYHSFSKDLCYIIPIGVIEQVEIKELTIIQISCKDVQTFRCAFSTPESCVEWHKRLTNAIVVPKDLDEIFAFAHYAWAGEDLGDDLPPYVCDKGDLKLDKMELESFKSEVERMNFNVTSEGPWRICVANRDFELCKTYPRYLLVPAAVSDTDLVEVAKFRSSKRVPVAVYRSEDLIGSYNKNYSYSVLFYYIVKSKTCYRIQYDDCCGDFQKLLIVDARSYSTAVANRVRGGGCEYPEYYPHCDIKFMNLANIHAVRKSFQALQVLCAMPADEANWFISLDSTKWLHYISGLLAAAVTVFSAVEDNGQPVVVHCSDGWDRTPQIVSLAEILLDPYYRTVKGFQVLVEREWIAFGHKFASRCGFTDDTNDRSPVFLQWLDCIQNIHRQYPCAFEFSLSFLMKLAQHVYSKLFGTFLCNSIAERKILSVAQRTFSVWKLLEQPEYRNHLYTPNGDQILIPAYSVRDLVVWRELFLGYSQGESFLSVASGLAKADESIFDGDSVAGKAVNGHGTGALKLGDIDLPDGAMASGLISFDSVDGDETDNGSNQSSTDTLVSPHNLALNPQKSLKPKTLDAAAPAIRGCQIYCEQVYKFIDPFDGLSRVRDDIQDRLVRLSLEHKERESALEQELCQTRVALLHHQNSALAAAAPAPPPTGDVSGDDEQGSLCSTEVSWEAVEEPVQTLWVPDHAVSHCTNCHNKFWLGRRKHHCRKCGQIFCADCSEYLVPLPDQKLFEPVRVCISCRQELKQVDIVFNVSWGIK
ncbi:myotubularin-related protein 4 [Nilaparvata lugens]|uniref:myotubularin-related protein 4 n=1 Tax=Nilaparvata lugens TaxID=108931 RepID=UPI00193DB91F|nr:myotubularin-related protein 4 [Nilaparvata lugens]